MKKLDYYRALVRERLSDSRYQHTMRTADMCRELAVLNAFDPDKAELAGILHDICKEISAEEAKRLFMTSKLFAKAGFELEELEAAERKLRHAPAGAAFAYDELKLDDEDLLAAIRFHTTGRAKMSELEKIVYLGDLVERGRAYHEAELYRDFALKDLNTGMYEAARWAIMSLVADNKRFSQRLFECYNYYLYKTERN